MDGMPRKALPLAFTRTLARQRMSHGPERGRGGSVHTCSGPYETPVTSPTGAAAVTSDGMTLSAVCGASTARSPISRRTSVGGR